ncbi:hypothetical protein HanRHA438_Chr09g0387021 [Helianthus annuus]|nr:hypothetical protein HanRHA438_Chr09g0387021 [Helianthus annuus]
MNLCRSNTRSTGVTARLGGRSGLHLCVSIWWRKIWPALGRCILKLQVVISQTWWKIWVASLILERAEEDLARSRSIYCSHCRDIGLWVLSTIIHCNFHVISLLDILILLLNIFVKCWITSDF